MIKIENNNSRPLNSILAKAYADKTVVMIVPSVEARATITVFLI